MQFSHVLSPVTIKLSILFLYKRILVGERFILRVRRMRGNASTLRVLQLDALISILPLPKIRKLHLPVGQNMALLLISTLGLFEIASALTPIFDPLLSPRLGSYAPAFLLLILFYLLLSPHLNAQCFLSIQAHLKMLQVVNEIQIKSQTGTSKKDHNDAGIEDALELRLVKGFGQQESGNKIVVKQEYVAIKKGVRAAEGV
ncbi:uncharacterized protein EAF01_007839 [Botrytis porri]|uniref:uncharacterized protein n=1 Tax=Botrytis porri TaxID=87229 RepID=UPI0019014121|nr:uncharacterized protein EAF01_007839 [Botrytis porri]KAF7900537.1 hypothetical protein EAF01_007839 [Botrytis porri]